MQRVDPQVDPVVLPAQRVDPQVDRVNPVAQRVDPVVPLAPVAQRVDWVVPAALQVDRVVPAALRVDRVVPAALDRTPATTLSVRTQRASTPFSSRLRRRSCQQRPAIWPVRGPNRSAGLPFVF